MPTPAHRTVDRLVLGAVLLGFVAVFAAAVLAVVMMQRNMEWTGRVAHTYEVENAIADYRILNERLETARRGYLLSGGAGFEQIYATTKAELPKAAARIRALTRDNPAQQARVARLYDLERAQFAAGDASIAARRAGRTASLAEFDIDAGVQATRAVRRLNEVMLREEREKLEQRNAARLDTIRNLVGVIVAAGVLLVGVAGGSLYVIYRFTRDLTASRAALERLNEGLEEEVRERTAELRRANEEIQRFAYIVSHDLRAPLVNVMGFTSELEAAAKPLSQLLERAEAEAPAIVTPDARLAVTSDLPESLGFIRASTQKMDRLINAILRLSREGRRVLAPEPVDLGRLFTGVADTLKHRADELGAVIEVAPGLPGVVSDRLALEQIFSNLMENALKYLKPGRPGRIEVRAARRGERVVVEIADNGRGVDPKDHERIFDLFRRSGAQDQPGEGIGLAHVRALGHRLGAVISVESALDRGATFRVSLPAILSPEAAAA